MTLEEPKSLEAKIEEAEKVEAELIAEIQKLPKRDQQVLIAALQDGSLEGFINQRRKGLRNATTTG